MRFQPIIIIGMAATFVFPQVAGAELTMTPQALGFVESTMDFCAKVDPDSAVKYTEAKKRFFSGATKGELEKTRSASEYLETYDSNTNELDKTPKDQAVKSCRAFLDGK
jgi:hypothetical protein